MLTTITFIIIILAVIGFALWQIKKARTITIKDEKLTPEFAKVIEKTTEHPDIIRVDYRGKVILMNPAEFKLWLGANRRDKNRMLELSMKGKDLTKHFRAV
jgi:hypothetical protein